MVAARRRDLPLVGRQSVIGLLNARLADGINLALHAKSAHWNVRGPNFIGLHKLFDEIYHVVEEHADDIAERLTALGGLAESDLATVQTRSTLGDHPLRASEAEHVAALANALGTFGRQLQAAITAAEDAGDPATADLFVEILRSIDKHRWLVEAHLSEGERHERWK